MLAFEVDSTSSQSDSIDRAPVTRECENFDAGSIPGEGWGGRKEAARTHVRTHLNIGDATVQPRKLLLAAGDKSRLRKIKLRRNQRN